MTNEKLNQILAHHKEWLLDKSKGRRANLRNAYLHRVDLRRADLRWADLSRANLCEVTSIARCEVSWSTHGECGRKLMAVSIEDEDIYFCGCFSGSMKELRAYIERGAEEYKQSRTIAADFCEARINEMKNKND